MSTVSKPAAAAAGGMVLVTLASSQFLMALDASVMNVSIASVANDLGTTVTGVQTAITAYTLVMASLMITGGKVGALIGRKRAFRIGTVVYAAGSLTTALAPNLTVLIIGWSGLEGIGAALIMPAVVALVASNFPSDRRTAAYGAVAAAGAIAVAAGPIIGGAVTTSFSWRWVFVGEVFVAMTILVLAGRLADPPLEERRRIDFVGVLLSIIGLAAVVLGVLKSSAWGWVTPKPGATTVLGLSPTIWMVSGGLVVLWLLFRWESRVEARGADPLIHRDLVQNRRLRNVLTLFGSQFFMQAGVFFTIPLFLSVILGLSALETGLQLLPLSVGLLLAAIGIPRVWPDASPRRVVRIGLLMMLAGTAALVGGLEPGAEAGVVLIPLALIGIGIGALASQLGAQAVASCDESQAAEVGGLQNTATNLGASLGTALVGSLLIAALTTSLGTALAADPHVSSDVRSQVTVKTEGGAPFVSDAQLEQALKEANVPAQEAEAVVEANRKARYDGLRVSLSVVLLVGIAALFLSGALPTEALSRAET